MPWTVGTRQDAVRLALSGYVDIFEANAFYRLLVELAEEPRRVEVDLAACASLDGSALQLLIAFREARVIAERPVSFAGAEDRVGRLVSRFGLAGA